MTTTKTVLATEESRQAVSTVIVEAALRDNALARQFVGPQLQALVSGLLDSDIAGKVYDRLGTQAYAYITATDRQPISIELAVVKDPLVTLVRLIERAGKDVQFNPDTIPSTILVMPADAIPDMSGYIRLMVLASGVLWFITILGWGVYLYSNRRQWVRAVYVVGWSVIAVSGVVIMASLFVPSMLAGVVGLIEIRGLVEDMAYALSEPLRVQYLLSTVIAAGVMLVVYLRHPMRRVLAKGLGRVAPLGE